ncbi:Uncharacterised protein [Mycobacteroides abscessus subsp. abscessus]|nr:Uncharacterised protein [Mycobacteroides abscessus subsp. abscessus]SKW59922.1 Uncharacterised protein [Mycobacteroides abscessus subsp. abscessus]
MVTSGSSTARLPTALTFLRRLTYELSSAVV